MAIIDSLVSYYKLDEAAGAVLDAHGVYDGTNNGATPNVAGKINTAYNFDGINDYITLGHIDEIEGSNTATFSFWIKPHNISSRRFIYSTDNGLDDDDTTFQARFWDADTFILSYKGTNGVVLATKTLTASTYFTVGVWAHVVSVLTATDIITYIDGAHVDTTARINIIETIRASTVAATLGRLGSYSAYYFDGLIDEVGIWTRDLIFTEVTQLYNLGNGLAYPFYRDSGINKYTAKLQGSVLKRRYDDTKELAVNKQTSYFASAVQLESKVKLVVDGCPSFLVHFYIAYAEELWKKKTDLERQIIYNKWLTRGLNAGLLQDVSCGLFGWGC